MNVSGLGEIERASKNMPIQGTGADITKVAVALIMEELDWMEEHNLGGLVKLKMQVHDQVDTTCKRSYAETWKPRLTELMEQAALLCIPSGILKAETKISERWEK
jgi:DNA polymerase-1